MGVTCAYRFIVDSAHSWSSSNKIRLRDTNLICQTHVVFVESPARRSCSNSNWNVPAFPSRIPPHDEETADSPAIKITCQLLFPRYHFLSNLSNSTAFQFLFSRTRFFWLGYFKMNWTFGGCETAWEYYRNEQKHQTNQIPNAFPLPIYFCIYSCW